MLLSAFHNFIFLFATKPPDLEKKVHTYNLYFHVELCCKDSHSRGYREDAIEKGIIGQTCMVDYTVTLVQEFYHFSAQKGQHQAGERRGVDVT